MGTAMLLENDAETIELSELDLDIQIIPGASVSEDTKPMMSMGQDCGTVNCAPTQSGATHSCSLLSMCRSCC
ncbi:hypothetical protein [Streptomyces sp. NPDC056061]|uniref:hypothetical protein n=1 Tax=Streptomyces sp. NPDC056061 TaxID=3345700 RepID=UPI0035DD3F1C